MCYYEHVEAFLYWLIYKFYKLIEVFTFKKCNLENMRFSQKMSTIFMIFCCIWIEYIHWVLVTLIGVQKICNISHMWHGDRGPAQNVTVSRILPMGRGSGGLCHTNVGDKIGREARSFFSGHFWNQFNRKRWLKITKKLPNIFINYQRFFIKFIIISCPIPVQSMTYFKWY